LLTYRLALHKKGLLELKNSQQTLLFDDSNNNVNYFFFNLLITSILFFKTCKIKNITCIVTKEQLKNYSVLMNTKSILVTGAILTGAAVMIGAFGSHALKPILQQVGKPEVFATANQYHFYHALGLLLVGCLHEKYPTITVTAYCFVGGILFFSGSLYVLALVGFTLLGAIAPIGGLAFMIGWVVLAYQIARKQ
jgi:uncharacterized membrane protein YgdD (TMEM256/DUF423 family)